MDEDIRLSRQHHILGERETQILRNLMAVEGGKPYIDDRLTRFPSERETSWLGNEERRFLQAVLPQFSLPAGLLERVQGQNEELSFDDAVELVRGLNYALL